MQTIATASNFQPLSTSEDETNSPYGRFQSTSRFGSLDGLRALSVLAVIWHHVGAKAHEGGVLSRGYLGVWIFFAISGFLITTLLLRERNRSGEISLGLFYIKRSLRIFPLYYTILLVYVVLVLLFERHQPAGKEFLANFHFFATYTSNWFVPFKDRVIFYFAWSLATEEQFYLIWPWVEKFIPASTSFVVLTLVTLHVASAEGMTGLSLLRGSFVEIVLAQISVPLCLGVLMAHGLHSKRGFALLSPLLYGRFASISWLGVFALLTAVKPSLGSRPLQELLISLSIVLLVGSCVIREDHMLGPLLRIKPLGSCGVVSYGMYLMHMLCVNIARPALLRMHLNYPILVFLLASAIAYGLAFLSFRNYESWFLKQKTNLYRPGLFTLKKLRDSRSQKKRSDAAA